MGRPPLFMLCSTGLAAMTSCYIILSSSRLFRRAAACLLLSLAFMSGGSPARAASGMFSFGSSALIASARGGLETPDAPLAWGWDLDRVWNFLEHALGNRRRLIQVATVMMCIALYVMFRARG